MINGEFMRITSNKQHYHTYYLQQGIYSLLGTQNTKTNTFNR